MARSHPHRSFEFQHALSNPSRRRVGPSTHTGSDRAERGWESQLGSPRRGVYRRSRAVSHSVTGQNTDCAHTSKVASGVRARGRPCPELGSFVELGSPCFPTNDHPMFDRRHDAMWHLRDTNRRTNGRPERTQAHRVSAHDVSSIRSFMFFACGRLFKGVSKVVVLSRTGTYRSGRRAAPETT
jgi:hypothetical protein